MNILRKHINYYVSYVLLIIVITKSCPLNDFKNITNSIFNSTKDTSIIPDTQDKNPIDFSDLTDVAIEEDDEITDVDFAYELTDIVLTLSSCSLPPDHLITVQSTRIPNVYLTLYTPPPEA